MFLENHQGRWLHHLSEQPIPAPDHPPGEELFPNIQPESPMMQLEAIISNPITSYMGEEANPHLTTTSLHVILSIWQSKRLYVWVPKLLQSSNIFGVWVQ